jgi:signal transduction histidine kinase
MEERMRERTILIVDDEEDIRLMLEDILSIRYRVLTAVDGIDALEQIDAHGEGIDLVLTDLRMPRMDGMELLERIGRNYPDLGVMLISAHGTVVEAVNALKNGAYDYITKPLPADLNDLYAQFERFFQTRTLRQQQADLQKEILHLSYFPRSNPNFILRAIPVEENVILWPGNERTTELLRRAAGEPPAVEGKFCYSQGETPGLFPANFPKILRRIVGTDEVVEIERVTWELRHFRHTYAPFVDNRSEIFINMIDITRQVENEQLRTVLEAGMEHEFKNHLTLITPVAEMLQAEMLGELNADQKEAVAQIKGAGSALLESLTERLEFSRAYSGHLRLDTREVDIYRLVCQIYDRLLRNRPESRCRLEGETYRSAGVPEGIPVICDPQYIERVLGNLITNALKHAPWVDVRIDRREEILQIEIVDAGEGMDAADAEGVWQLGYRAKNRKGGSTGIGLPYSRLIVEAHGGQIGVHTVSGKGSRFYFTLPLAGMPAQ